MKFEYNPEISLGNLLQIITILGGIFVGYSTLVQANAVQDRVLFEHSQRIEEAKIIAKEERKEIQTDINDVAIAIRNLDEKFTAYVIQEAKRRN